MSISFNVENSMSCKQYNQAAVPVNKEQKSGLLSQLDKLVQEEQELLKALKEIKKKKEQIQAQLAQLESSEKNELHKPTQTEKVVEKALKVEEFVKPYLLIDTTKIMQAKDSKGTWEHYSHCLVSKDNEAIAIHQPPTDVKKYGSSSQIVIDDGTNKTVLKADEWYHVQRLIHYFSTDFNIFRKGINAETVDRNGCYSNKYVAFDCQRFSYYLLHGKEGTFRNWSKPTPEPDYRNDAKHIAGGS